MKSNPILDKGWRIKDQLAAKMAGFDMDRFVEQLRPWFAAQPPFGLFVPNAEKLRQLVIRTERARAEESALALNDKSASKQQ